MQQPTIRLEIIWMIFCKTIFFKSLRELRSLKAFTKFPSLHFSTSWGERLFHFIPLTCNECEYLLLLEHKLRFISLSSWRELWSIISVVKTLLQTSFSTDPPRGATNWSSFLLLLRQLGTILISTPDTLIKHTTTEKKQLLESESKRSKCLKFNFINSLTLKIVQN